MVPKIFSEICNRQPEKDGDSYNIFCVKNSKCIFLLPIHQFNHVLLQTMHAQMNIFKFKNCWIIFGREKHYL